jgi:hypothetical protein
MGRVASKAALVAGAGGGVGGAGAEALARKGRGGVLHRPRMVLRPRLPLLGFASPVVAQPRRFLTSATVRRSLRRSCANSGGSISCSNRPGSATSSKVNLTGMFHVGQAAARQIVKQGGGSIVNVVSQLAEVARPERATYVASKRGARSLTQAMAVDLAAHGIRVNAIAPGPTLTGAVACRRRVALGTGGTVTVDGGCLPGWSSCSDRGEELVGPR